MDILNYVEKTHKKFKLIVLEKWETGHSLCFLVEQLSTWHESSIIFRNKKEYICFCFWIQRKNIHLLLICKLIVLINNYNLQSFLWAGLVSVPPSLLEPASTSHFRLVLFSPLFFSCLLVFLFFDCLLSRLKRAVPGLHSLLREGKTRWCWWWLGPEDASEAIESSLPLSSLSISWMLVWLVMLL